LFIYNVRTDETTVRVFGEPCPVKLILGTNFLDTQDNKLYSYETYYSTPNSDYDGPTVASLDLSSYRWTAEAAEQLPSPLHHHGSYFDPLTRKNTIFGGFGNMHYSKSFYSYDVDEKAWTTLQG